MLLAAELGVSVESMIGYRPRYNIAPTDSHWIVRTRHEDREILPAKWGLINFWITDRAQAFKNINARAETVQKLRSFREAFAQRRCVVPADGFFEWTGPKEDRRPILTTTPNSLLAPVHNRMPVILEDEAVDEWLYVRQTADSLIELLRPADDNLPVATAVSARVNSVKNDDPDCLRLADDAVSIPGLC